MFAGFGSGRENKRSLVPGWYGGWGPRIGMAYAPDNKSTIRAAFGRSFSRVTAVQGSGHFAGFIGQYSSKIRTTASRPHSTGIRDLPAYTLPPSIDPAFSNGNTSTGGKDRKPCVRPRTCTGLSPCSVKLPLTRFSASLTTPMSERICRPAY